MSDFRCVVCNMPIVEIHHIIPQEEKGPDTIENAVALCANCHSIYGGNKSKRQELIELRDRTYRRIAERFRTKQEYIHMEKAEGKYKVQKKKEDIILRCNISLNENFEQAAKKIYRLIYEIGEREPNLKRALVVEIQGHRNEEGGYDHDMFELQYEFLLKCMLPFLHSLHIPLVSVTNAKPQKNLPTGELMICSNREELENKEKDTENYQIYKLQGEK